MDEIGYLTYPEWYEIWMEPSNLEYLATFVPELLRRSTHEKAWAQEWCCEVETIPPRKYTGGSKRPMRWECARVLRYFRGPRRRAGQFR